MVRDKNGDDDTDTDKPKTRKRRSTKTEKANDATETQDDVVTLPESTKKRRTTSSKATSAADSHETTIVVDDKAIEGTTVPTKKVKPAAHQVITDKDDIPKLWDNEKAAANGSYSKCCLYLLKMIMAIIPHHRILISHALYRTYLCTP